MGHFSFEYNTSRVITQVSYITETEQYPLLPWSVKSPNLSHTILKEAFSAYGETELACLVSSYRLSYEYPALVLDARYAAIEEFGVKSHTISLHTVETWLQCQPRTRFFSPEPLNLSFEHVPPPSLPKNHSSSENLDPDKVLNMGNKRVKFGQKLNQLMGSMN